MISLDSVSIRDRYSTSTLRAACEGSVGDYPPEGTNGFTREAAPSGLAALSGTARGEPGCAGELPEALPAPSRFAQAGIVARPTATRRGNSSVLLII